MDVARGEMVETELDRLIEKRAAVEDPEAKEALWLRSVERYNARRQEQHRVAWCDYHRAAAERIERTARELAAEHRARAEALMDTEATEGAA